MRTRWICAVAALALVGIPAFAAVPYRLEVIAQLGDQRVADAEVCFFHAGEGTGPFEAFLETRGVRCLPADQVLELPPGRWWFYVRQSERNLISTNPSRITIPEPGPPTDLFKPMEVGLRSAAKLDLRKVEASLGPDDRLALYISNERTDLLPMIIPLARGETTAVVPSGMPVVLLLLRNSLVVNMSDPLSLDTGELRLAPPFQPLATDKGNVIAWVEFPEEERTPADYWRLLPAPKITLEGDGKTFTPAIAARAGFGTDGALLFFRDVPFADYKLRLRGPFWASGDLPVEAKNAGIIIPRQGLMTRPGASLTVEWSVDGPAPDAPRGGDCAPASEKKPSEPPKNAAARLFVCDGLQPSMTLALVNRARCKPLASPESIDGRTRRAAFHGVKPGTYLVSVYEPGYPPGFAIVTLSTALAGHSAISFEAFHVLGKVTLDDKPVKARLEFRDGMAFSGDDGHYYGGLPLPPKHFAITVIRCSDGVQLTVHKPLQPLETNVAHDIRIETNEIHITVVNAETHQGVSKASVSINSVAQDNEWDTLSDKNYTDADGRSTYHNAPADQKVAVCASATHYKRTCSDTFTLADTHQHSVQIELPPNHHAGRILTDHAILFALLYFVGPDRAVRERVPVNRDGTFDYQLDHASPEYIVVVSNLPLFTQNLRDTQAEELEISVPSLPVRSFDVSLSPSSGKKDAWIGLFVAGRYIPDAALGIHESTRGMQSMILGGGPLRVLDIFDAGPIQVALGASREDLVEDPEDRFIFPKAASWPLVIKAVDATNHVVF